MLHYLYKITNKDTGKAYIGVTKHKRIRWQKHSAGQGSKELAKDLPADLLFEVLETGSEDYIYKKEVEEILTQQTLVPDGYNILIGGLVPPGYIGEANGNSKLTEAQVYLIRHKYNKDTNNGPALALEYSVSRTAIVSIINGHTWKHIGGPIQPKQTRIVITQEVIDSMQEARDGGMPVANIAKIYPVHIATVYKYTTA